MPTLAASKRGFGRLIGSVWKQRMEERLKAKQMIEDGRKRLRTKWAEASCQTEML